MRSVVLALPLVLAFAPLARAGGDFNGDGFDDAALAAPADPVLGVCPGESILDVLAVAVTVAVIAGFIAYLLWAASTGNL